MGFPEHGDDRDAPVYLDADRADDLKQRMKDDGRWPPTHNLPAKLEEVANCYPNAEGLPALLREAAAEIRHLRASKPGGWGS